MTAELLHTGNDVDGHEPDLRAVPGQRRATFEVVDQERRKAPGRRPGDLEQQLAIIATLGVEVLPEYLQAPEGNSETMDAAVTATNGHAINGHTLANGHTHNGHHSVSEIVNGTPTPPAAELPAGVEIPPSLLKANLNLQDTFIHWTGGHGDEDADKMLPLAWRTHAAGYLRTGLAKPAAVKEGLLSTVIDKSRHVKEGITYYLAINPNDPEERSTARLIDAPSIEELPTFSLTKNGISEETKSDLQDAVCSGIQFRELGALANSKNGFCKGASEILRQVIVDTVSKEGQPSQLLFVSMVDKARAGLIPTLSAATLEPIGEPTVLEENEFRQETTLIPIVINTDLVVSNIFNAFKKAERFSERRRYLESALYFAEPLPERFIPDELLAIRAAIGRNTMQNVIESEN